MLQICQEQQTEELLFVNKIPTDIVTSLGLSYLRYDVIFLDKLENKNYRVSYASLLNGADIFDLYELAGINEVECSEVIQQEKTIIEWVEVF